MIISTALVVKYKTLGFDWHLPEKYRGMRVEIKDSVEFCKGMVSVSH